MHYRSTYPQVHVLGQGTTALLYQHGTDEDDERDIGHRAKGNEGYESSQEDNQAKGDEGYEGKEKNKAMGPAELIFTVCSPCNTFIEQLQLVRSGFRVREYYCSNCGGPLEIQSAVH